MCGAMDSEDPKSCCMNCKAFIMSSVMTMHVCTFHPIALPIPTNLLDLNIPWIAIFPICNPYPITRQQPLPIHLPKKGKTPFSGNLLGTSPRLLNYSRVPIVPLVHGTMRNLTRLHLPALRLDLKGVRILDCISQTTFFGGVGFFIDC